MYVCMYACMYACVLASTCVLLYCIVLNTKLTDDYVVIMNFLGMHGAGIAHAVHMSIGTKYCCGVIEIFPKGAHSHIHGFGNMLRRLGIRYSTVQ